MAHSCPIFITVAVLGSSIILAIIYKPSLIEKTLHIKMYQMGRINSWLNPYAYSNGDGYHLTESLKAIYPVNYLVKVIITEKYTFQKTIPILFFCHWRRNWIESDITSYIPSFNFPSYPFSYKNNFII